MTRDLDILLAALHVEIDDHVIPSGWHGRGQPKKLPDAELVCLAVAQVLLGARLEYRWLRMSGRSDTCFRICASADYRKRVMRPRRCWPRRTITWPGSARPGTTGSG